MESRISKKLAALAAMGLLSAACGGSKPPAEEPGAAVGDPAAEKHSCKGENGCKGEAEAHSCKGENGCHGEGDAHSCKGENGCKGEGDAHSCKGENGCHGEEGVPTPAPAPATTPTP